MAREVGKKVDILLPPGTDQSWAYKAYMEASMAPHDLTERAEGLIRRLFSLHLDDNGDPDPTDVQTIVEMLQQTRRAALMEAADEIERFIDYSGGCVGTENDPRVVAVNRFITINIVPLLNRLAQEG